MKPLSDQTYSIDETVLRVRYVSDKAYVATVSEAS